MFSRALQERTGLVKAKFNPRMSEILGFNVILHNQKLGMFSRALQERMFVFMSSAVHLNTWHINDSSCLSQMSPALI